MNIHYPIFTVDSGGSIHMALTPAMLTYYEQIDVEEGEYAGWDVCGYPIRLEWEPGVGSKVQLVGETPQTDELRAAILKHAEIEVPNVPFSYDGSCDDMVELFQAVERHIEYNRPSVMKRIRRLFQSKG